LHCAIYTLSLHDALPIWPILPISTPTETDVINLGRFCKRTAFCTTLIINPAKPIKLKATKYSINACNGVKIHASPVTICRINDRSEEHTSELQSRFELVC